MDFGNVGLRYLQMEVLREAAASAQIGSAENENVAGTNDIPNDGEIELDVLIKNVVGTCKVERRWIKENCVNVEIVRKRGILKIRLCHTGTMATIYANGRITCAGATSYEEAEAVARNYANLLKHIGLPIRFRKFRILTVVGSCRLPFGIRTIEFFDKYYVNSIYSSEKDQVIFNKVCDPKAEVTISSNGTVIVIASSYADVTDCCSYMYPILCDFKKERSQHELEQLRAVPIGEPVLTWDWEELRVNVLKRATGDSNVPAPVRYGNAGLGDYIREYSETANILKIDDEVVLDDVVRECADSIENDDGLIIPKTQPESTCGPEDIVIDPICGPSATCQLREYSTDLLANDGGVDLISYSSADLIQQDIEFKEESESKQKKRNSNN